MATRIHVDIYESDETYINGPRLTLIVDPKDLIIMSYLNFVEISKSDYNLVLNQFKRDDDSIPEFIENMLVRGNEHHYLKLT